MREKRPDFSSSERAACALIGSRKGNPTVETLQEILGPLGLRVSVALDKAA